MDAGNTEHKAQAYNEMRRCLDQSYRVLSQANQFSELPHNQLYTSVAKITRSTTAIIETLGALNQRIIEADIQMAALSPTEHSIEATSQDNEAGKIVIHTLASR